MDIDLINDLALKTIEFPVHYVKAQQTIWDGKKMMVCDIKGWGKIQFMEKSEDRQDAIGELIVNLLNSYYKKTGLSHTHNHKLDTNISVS